MSKSFDEKLEILSSYKRQAHRAKLEMTRQFTRMFKKGDDIRWLCGRDENTGEVVETRFKDVSPHLIARNHRNKQTYAVSAHDVVGIV